VFVIPTELFAIQNGTVDNLLVHLYDQATHQQLHVIDADIPYALSRPILPGATFNHPKLNGQWRLEIRPKQPPVQKPVLTEAEIRADQKAKDFADFRGLLDLLEGKIAPVPVTVAPVAIPVNTAVRKTVNKAVARAAKDNPNFEDDLAKVGHTIDSFKNLLEKTALSEYQTRQVNDPVSGFKVWNLFLSKFTRKLYDTQAKATAYQTQLVQFRVNKIAKHNPLHWLKLKGLLSAEQVISALTTR
jgi:hypothetical protein